MADLAALRAANEKRWENARLTRSFTSIARQLVALRAKARYQAVSARAGVHWAFIAVTHERECSQHWTVSFAKGDPVDRVSRHVQAGRGPFKSCEDGAVYA